MQPFPAGIRHSREQRKGIGAPACPRKIPAQSSHLELFALFSCISISEAAFDPARLLLLLGFEGVFNTILTPFPPPPWHQEQDQPGMCWPWTDRHIPVPSHQLGTSPALQHRTHPVGQPGKFPSLPFPK